MRTHTLAIRLTLFLLLIHATSISYAKPGDCFIIAKYLGMNKAALTAMFKRTPSVRGWTVSPMQKDKASRTYQMVSWQAPAPSDGVLKFLLVDDRVEIVFFSETDYFYDEFENDLNRNFEARSAHEWVDGARNVWGLNRVKGTNSLVIQVAYPHY